MFEYLLCRELECGKRKKWWSKKVLLGHPKGRIDWVQPSGQIFWVLCQKETAMEHQGEGRHRPLWTKTDAVGQEKHVGKKEKKKTEKIVSATAAAIDHSMQWVSGMVTSVVKGSYPAQASTSFPRTHWVWLTYQLSRTASLHLEEQTVSDSTAWHISKIPGEKFFFIYFCLGFLCFHFINEAKLKRILKQSQLRKAKLSSTKWILKRQDFVWRIYFLLFLFYYCCWEF